MIKKNLLGQNAALVKKIETVHNKSKLSTKKAQNKNFVTMNKLEDARAQLDDFKESLAIDPLDIIHYLDSHNNSMSSIEDIRKSFPQAKNIFPNIYAMKKIRKQLYEWGEAKIGGKLSTDQAGFSFDFDKQMILFFERIDQFISEEEQLDNIKVVDGKEVRWITLFSTGDGTPYSQDSIVSYGFKSKDQSNIPRLFSSFNKF